MIKILNDKYKKFGQKNFLIQSAVLCTISDLISIYYVLYVFMPQAISLKLLAKQHMQLGHNPSYPELIEIQKLLISTMSTVLIVFMGIHLIIYIMLAKNKIWALRYTSGYAMLGIVLTFSMAVSLVNTGGIFWTVIMLLTVLIYFYVYLGLHFFKKNRE